MERPNAAADVQRLFEQIYDLLDKPDLNRHRDGFRELTDEISTLCMIQATPAISDFGQKLFEYGLEPQQIAIVEFLALHKGRVVSYAAIYEAVEFKRNTSNALRVRISNIRKKLIENHAPFRIETVCGFGYRFKDGAGSRPGIKWSKDKSPYLGAA